MGDSNKKNYMDFDAFFSEKEQKQGPVLKLFGEEHELPPSIPAGVMLMVARLQEQRGGSSEFSAEEVNKLLYMILGRERVELWMEKGMSMEQLSDILTWAMEQYNPNAQAPAKAAKARRTAGR